MGHGMFSEKTLIKRCLSQDKKAWDAFVDRYSRLISHAIVKTLAKYSCPPEQHVVEDLFQTVFYDKILLFRSV